MATVNIYVSLDTSTSANPHVILTTLGGGSARSQQASSGDTIKWQKHDINDQFDITSLNPTGTGTAFATATTGGGGQWLKSVYQPPSTNQDAQYPYTLTVTKDGIPYDTTKTTRDLVEDRPVIRN